MKMSGQLHASVALSPVSIEGSLNTEAGLDAVAKKKFLSSPGIEVNAEYLWTVNQ
jgi:hypothetical protein